MSRNINKNVDFIYSITQSSVSQLHNKDGRHPSGSASGWGLKLDYPATSLVFLAKVVGLSDKVVAPIASSFLDPVLGSLKQEITNELKVNAVAVRGIQISFLKRCFTDLASYVGNLVPTVDLVDGLLSTSTDIEYG